ncbi:MAG TPA: bifunctional hydroxymethylpyrimidine kinase/phosphomethylpyrimidine kinase [Anaeromyxobacteraceae bacterium]|nr:bifunctional hydroxymethylpyrimidine kinase/phosphomethylpyrimidine kinase [Anaeromyxobacteraceae bacterium]
MSGARPRVLVLAGLDPSGGAGLAADGEALAAVGARMAPVATALTVQGAGGAYGAEAVPLPLVRAQVEGLLAGRGVPLGAAKTGMLATAEIAAELARLLGLARLRKLPLVVDPVLASSSGLPLLDTGGLAPGEALAPLLSRATLVTPNVPELAALAGAPGRELSSEDDLVAAARSLACAAVLVKGGHRKGAPVDLLVTRRAVRRFQGRRRRGTRRGTGCRLASAIAGLVAQGAPLAGAVAGAKAMVERYLDEG